jgi:Zincin-like metallopeptidase
VVLGRPKKAAFEPPFLLKPTQPKRQPGSMIGLPCDIPNHASYLQSWIDVLKQDRREIFRAMAEAQGMADYILGLHPDYAEIPNELSDADEESATLIASPLAA